jgi:hypothetical protein
VATLLASALTGCDGGRDPRPAAEPSPGCVALVLDGRSGPGCRTVRVRFPEPRFVPQGLAVAGAGTAYVSGYRYEPVPGSRECQVARVDLRTGDMLAWTPLLEGVVPGVGRQYCRHGGGLTRSPAGLWVAGAARLGLVDPVTLGVLRVWVVDEAIRASTVAHAGDQLVLGVWRERRRGSIHRYSYADLLAPGATRLDADAGGTGVAPVRSRPAPSRLQAAVPGPGGLWLVRSTSFCGELVTPAGRRLGHLPGAEGVLLRPDGRLVVASESGSRAYQRMGGRPDVPTLTLTRTDALVRTPTGCW